MGDSTFDVTRKVVLTDYAMGFWYYSGSSPAEGTGGRYPVVGDDNGGIYLCGPVSELTGTPVSCECYWTSKVMDFGDQNDAVTNKWKWVDHIRLLYEDVSSAIPTTVYLSHDGGTTWTSVSKDIGTGAGTPKYSDFYFSTKPESHGQHFQIKIGSPAVNKDFIWTGAEIFYTPMAESFTV
jgi:hypothetical protein